MIAMTSRGDWVATEADDDVRRYGIGLDTDDSGWAPIAVPGHWRDTPKFATSDGPLMYRHRFRSTPPPEGRRRWVTFDGIFYQADAWLDGAYLGDPEGYFFPHSFDITALSGIGDEHVLAVEVTCAPQYGTTGRRNITGVFQQWEGLDRDWNPGGLWRPVRFYETGPVRIDRLRVLCRDADERRAHVVLASRLDSDEQRTITVRTMLDGAVADEHEQVIAAGENDVEWSIDIADPKLWWPRALGDQPLVQVAIEVDVDGEPSDRRERRTGLRQVDWNDWICSVNGERIFLKGANLLPTDAGLANEEPVSEIHFDGANGFELFVGDDGMNVRLGNGQHRQKLRRLRMVLERLAREKTRPSYVYLDNVRSPERVTVRLPRRKRGQTPFSRG